MPEALSDEQWTAMRALVEGKAPTHGRVAASAGVYQTTLSRRAAAEGWRTLDFRRPRIRAAYRTMIELAAQAAAGELPDEEVPEEAEGRFEADAAEDAPVVAAALEPLPNEGAQARLARIGDMLTRQADMVLRRAEAGRPLDRRQVAALSAMVQLAERISVLARDQIVKEEEKNDEELAELLKRIDDRILYLAAFRACYLLVEHGRMTEEEARAAVGAEELKVPKWRRPAALASGDPRRPAASQ